MVPLQEEIQIGWAYFPSFFVRQHRQCKGLTISAPRKQDTATNNPLSILHTWKLFDIYTSKLEWMNQHFNPYPWVSPHFGSVQFQMLDFSDCQNHYVVSQEDYILWKLWHMLYFCITPSSFVSVASCEWSNWSTWSSCSDASKPVEKTRTRTCDNLNTSGASCQIVEEEKAECGKGSRLHKYLAKHIGIKSIILCKALKYFLVFNYFFPSLVGYSDWFWLSLFHV